MKSRNAAAPPGADFQGRNACHAANVTASVSTQSRQATKARSESGTIVSADFADSRRFGTSLVSMTFLFFNLRPSVQSADKHCVVPTPYWKSGRRLQTATMRANDSSTDFASTNSSMMLLTRSHGDHEEEEFFAALRLCVRTKAHQARPGALLTSGTHRPEPQVVVPGEPGVVAPERCAAVGRVGVKTTAAQHAERARRRPARIRCR